MQIRKLVINDHKCLVDFRIDFHTNNSGSSTILIGENGTGKSTLLDAILEILISFDSKAIEKKIKYNYELEYEYAGKLVSIIQEENYYNIEINNEMVFIGNVEQVKKQLSEYGYSIFPERIISFYSGENFKSGWRFNRINIDYKMACRKVIRQYRDSLMHGSTFDSVLPKRKFNRCIEELTPIYLLSILGGEESFEKDYLRTSCHFRGIQDITIGLDVDKLETLFNGEIDEQFEMYMNYLVEFLDERFVDAFRRGFLYRNHNFAYYGLRNIEELDIDSISIYNFFEKLQSLFDAEFSVFISVGESRVNCNDLSEGQRQLIKILGMLGICKSEDCLVVMDEPDAHMNPRWKYDLKKTIDESLKEAIDTQALIATHDPLVINGVEKEFIRIFTYHSGIANDNGFYFTKVIVPTEDTVGMGIDGLLQSQYYGLNTTLDAKTQELLEEKRNLMVKRKHGNLTDADRQRLQELTDRLERLDFSRNIPTDNYFDEFVVAMQAAYEGRPKPILTPEEIEERNRMAREIAERLIGQ